MSRHISTYDFENKIIYKLKSRGRWGGSMMNISDLVKAVPKENHKEVKKAADELFKKGILLKKSGNRNEFRYSLNTKNKKEIDQRFKKYTKDNKKIDFTIY